MQTIRVSASVSRFETTTGAALGACSRVALLSVLIFATAAGARAQWSITASAPVPGTASANANGPTTTNTLPAGPVAAGVYLSASQSGPGVSASASASWMPSVPGQTAPIAFTARAMATAASSLSTFVLVYGTASTQLDLTLQTPAPVGGRLVLTGGVSSFGGGGSASISVDVGNDGTVEFIATQGPVGGAGYGPVDVPVPLGVTTIHLECMVNHAVLFPDNGATTVTVHGQLFPNEPATHSFDATGAGTTLLVDHPVGDTVTLSLSPIGQTPVLLAFGFQPVVVPLSSTVTLLVTLDTVLPVGSVTLTLPPLPPGSALYAQGLVLQLGGFRGSNSVRAIWP